MNSAVHTNKVLNFFLRLRDGPPTFGWAGDLRAITEPSAMDNPRLFFRTGGLVSDTATYHRDQQGRGEVAVMWGGRAFLADRALAMQSARAPR